MTPLSVSNAAACKSTPRPLLEHRDIASWHPLLFRRRRRPVVHILSSGLLHRAPHQNRRRLLLHRTSRFEALRSHSLPSPPIPISDARSATTTLAPQSYIPIVLVAWGHGEASLAMLAGVAGTFWLCFSATGLGLKRSSHRNSFVTGSSIIHGKQLSNHNPRVRCPSPMVPSSISVSVGCPAICAGGGLAIAVRWWPGDAPKEAQIQAVMWR